MTATVAPEIEPVLRGRGLDHHFELRCNHPGVGAALGDALGALHCPGAEITPTAYDLLFDERTAEWTLLVNGVPPDPPRRHAKYPVGRLMWSINRRAVTESPRLVRVHASVAERDGLAVVLPAAMEAGKTTLVTALVRDGFRYLSDEVAAIDPLTGEIVAYPKPLGLDPGSWRLFPDLAPESVAGIFDQQWLVNPDRIRPAATARRALPAVVVAPRYRSGAGGTPEPLPRSDGLRALVDQTFDFRRHPQRDLETLADLVRCVPCHRLEVDDLRRATSVIHTLVDEADPGGPG